MSELKIKLPPMLKRRQSESRGPVPQAEASTSHAKKKRRVNALESSIPDKDEREAEESPIDIVGGAESRSFDREIFYDGTAGDFPEDESRMSTKRRPKKKKQIVYSDNDDFDIPDSGMIQHDDQDDDFLPEPLPRSSKSKAKAKSAISKTKRSPKAKDVIATSRVLSTVVVSADTEDAEASRKASERGSGDISSQRPVALVEKESEEVVATESVTPKKKKLPTIKKNKTLVTPSSSTNITSGPASSAVAVVSEPASREVVSGRKPAATAGNADLDLTNTDIYNSLFKSTGTTPRSGLNRREKEEERRRELENMRDRARVQRIAHLNIGSFDFVSGQEKLLNFEAKLKERNSAALFPHYLAACLKQRKKWFVH